eukprot:3986700-Pleurochrysis_carterae.AAC.1
MDGGQPLWAERSEPEVSWARTRGSAWYREAQLGEGTSARTQEQRGDVPATTMHAASHTATARTETESAG